ncbi:hypothetical protein [Allokutzneria oryzae]|uniref:Uncharacterized protein n=1 Tax=Allokutzneria oryzae TaxID=1378989 RepID=A0ABV6A156_9PSEU
MRAMRVSLVVGAVAASVVFATGGAAVAASKATVCGVFAHTTATIYNKADKPVGTLSGSTATSACSRSTYHGRSVVFLAKGDRYVLAADVSAPSPLT